MKETVYSTGGQNRKGVVLLGFLLSGLFVSLFFFSVEWGYRSLIQAFVYLFGGGVIWVSVRYMFSAFIYEITCLDGEWLLVVAAKQGKRYTTLCRMPLYQMVALSPLSSPEKQEKIKKKAKAFHRFRQNMFPEAICFCLFEDGEDTTALELEIDLDFWNTLSCFLKENQINNQNCEEL